MIVPFASICDRCGKRGPEYEAYCSCSECQSDLCPECGPELEDYLPATGPCLACEGRYQEPELRASR